MSSYEKEIIIGYDTTRGFVCPIHLIANYVY